MHQLAIAYEIWLSFEKCLFEEQGYDSVELIRSVWNGNLPVEYDDYFNDWLRYIESYFEIEGG